MQGQLKFDLKFSYGNLFIGIWAIPIPSSYLIIRFADYIFETLFQMKLSTTLYLFVDIYFEFSILS
ncbi:MAG TPA: hypothetical protein DCY95_10770 [Algoriphagus sp.]|nr:hypothetical protein [Algoriphagus sp.]HAZ25039.1 hypothetical protein [Algoriphagus sp.]HCX76094.1 hypothetical protein [Algoriphagus sp.]